MNSYKFKNDLYEEQEDAIGGGSTTEVFIVKWISDNTIFAKKKIKLSYDNSARMAQAEQ